MSEHEQHLGEDRSEVELQARNFLFGVSREEALKVPAILRSLLIKAGIGKMWTHFGIICGNIMTTRDVDHGLFRSTNRPYGVRASIRFGRSCGFQRDRRR
jgi:hypothetical protein